jgi:hypothetical protein
MKIDDSNKRYSMIIAGIMVLSIVSIFVAYLSAIGGQNLHFSNGFQILGVGTNPRLTEGSADKHSEDSRNSNPVPVAQNCTVGPFDTEAGEIEIIDCNFPYIDEYGNLLPLPLCITNEMAQTWNWTVRVKGGYEPQDTFGYWPLYGITFWQDKNKDGEPELIQGWNIDWTRTVKCDGCCSCWEWFGEPAWCGNKVCLDSNQYPTLIGCSGTYCDIQVPDGQTEIPGKEVYMKIDTLWEGCPLDTQQFAIILAHKKDEISLIPNFRIKIFIVS